MKISKKLVAAGVLCLSVGAFAVVQNHMGGIRDHFHRLHGGHQAHGLAQSQPANTAPLVRHLSEAFVEIATYDANKDGKLDTAEAGALGNALADGTIEFPSGHTPPPALTENPQKFAAHITEMYALVAPFDADHNGTLNSAEQDAMRSAIDDGELRFPGAHH